MSNTCGEIRFMEGGTIKDATIVSSSIVNSSISSSNIDSSSVTNLSSIDSASAMVILQAIANLSPSELRVLTDALLAALRTASGNVSDSCQTSYGLPASLIGGGSYLLGNPDGWLPIADGLIPVYSPCDCAEEQ